MKDLISIAKIVNFHGIKGEVKVGFTKGREQQIQACQKVYVKNESGFEALHITSIRLHKGMAIIKFKEFDDINATIKFKGKELFIEKESVENSLENDEYLVSDLENLDVYDQDNQYIGKIFGVGENKATNIISVIDKNDKIHLIPFVKELVPSVDIKNKKVVINNIEGLID